MRPSLFCSCACCAAQSTYRALGRRLALLGLLMLSAAAPAQQATPSSQQPLVQPSVQQQPNADTAATTPTQADDWSDESWDEIEQWAEDTAADTAASEGGMGTDANATPTATIAGDTANEFSSLQLVRRGKDGKERRIQVVRKGTDDASGTFTICSRRDEEAANTPSVAVFSETGAGGVEITIDKNVIQVPLALVTQKPKQPGEEGSDGSIEAGGGTARSLEEIPDKATDRLTRCGVAVERAEQAGAVKVTQGQTKLTGASLKYGETDGIAHIAGPISFERAGTAQADATQAATEQSEAPPEATERRTRLSGTADSIEVDVDNERTVLVGNVILNSDGGRTSRAARVEYDDAANLARLIGTSGQPAVTVRGNERLQAAEILYYLDSDEAVAQASAGVRISGKFQDGE